MLYLLLSRSQNVTCLHTLIPDMAHIGSESDITPAECAAKYLKTLCNILTNVQRMKPQRGDYV